MDNLTDLTVKSIEDHAKSKVRLASLETAVTNMSVNNQKILDKIGEIQTSLALIVKEQAHTDKEVKEVRVDLDILIKDHSPCSTLAQAKIDNNSKHSEMKRRIDDMENKCAQCPVHGYKELSVKVEQMSLDIQALTKALKVITYTIKVPVLNIDVPVWVLFVWLVIFNTVFVAANNWEWLMKAWSVVK
jgi:hypothetical protein